MCPTLEKLRSDVALLAGMQRYFWVAYARGGQVFPKNTDFTDSVLVHAYF